MRLVKCLPASDSQSLSEYLNVFDSWGTSSESFDVVRNVNETSTLFVFNFRLHRKA